MIAPIRIPPAEETILTPLQAARRAVAETLLVQSPQQLPRVIPNWKAWLVAGGFLVVVVGYLWTFKTWSIHGDS